MKIFLKFKELMTFFVNNFIQYLTIFEKSIIKKISYLL